MLLRSNVLPILLFNTQECKESKECVCNTQDWVILSNHRKVTYRVYHRCDNFGGFYYILVVLGLKNIKKIFLKFLTSLAMGTNILFTWPWPWPWLNHDHVLCFEWVLCLSHRHAFLSDVVPSQATIAGLKYHRLITWGGCEPTIQGSHISLKVWFVHAPFLSTASKSCRKFESYFKKWHIYGCSRIGYLERSLLWRVPGMVEQEYPPP